MCSSVRIGTRGSSLALAQATIVEKRLNTLFPEIETSKVIIKTSGDQNQTDHIQDIGGKNIFIKELEVALLQHEIDIAVHSFKDITSSLAQGLECRAYLKPESSADCLITTQNQTLDQLPEGAKIGTGSMRRKCQLQKIRPDIEVVPIRGNVQTRMDRVSKDLDGVMLSEAGLIRLGLESSISQRFDPLQFIPAPGQGVIAIEARQNDPDSCSICARLSDSEQHPISQFELEFLKGIGFNCSVPFGLYVTKSTDGLNGLYGVESSQGWNSDSFTIKLDQLDSATATLVSNIRELYFGN